MMNFDKTPYLPKASSAVGRFLGSNCSNLSSKSIPIRMVDREIQTLNYLTIILPWSERPDTGIWDESSYS